MANLSVGAVEGIVGEFVVSNGDGLECWSAWASFLGRKRY